jgi:hypothetical protein
MFYHACFWYGVFVWFSSVFKGFWLVCAEFLLATFGQLFVN